MDLKLGKCPEELIMTTADSKKIIELNGHFKNFDPLDFKDIEI